MDFIKTIDNKIQRFGHTLTLICKEKNNEKAILFGGVNGNNNQAIMTKDTYVFYIVSKKWKKLKGK